MSRLSIQRHLITGIITVIPLWITWLLFQFAFNQLSNLGLPVINGFAYQIRASFPAAAEMLLNPWFQRAYALVLVLLTLYLLGLAMNRVIGQRLFGYFEQALNRLPLVQNIYGAAKRFMATVQQKPEGVQRIVLVNFPNSEMKAVGFVTRTLVEQDTGEQLVAVYVPTAPNPTSGYIEILPIGNVISTDWTFDEAMSFVISGGAISPNSVRYRNNPADAGNKR